MKSKRQFSFGGVVFRKTRSAVRIALISRAGRTVWCLPKGHIQKRETAERAALREVEEETGLTAEIVRKLGDISYWFVPEQQKSRVFKKVSFFLMRHTGGNTKDHDFEVDEARWFPVDAALKKMSYPAERLLVQKAKRMIR